MATPAQILADFTSHLNLYERSEILSYKEVFYFAPDVVKINARVNRPLNCGYDRPDGHYRCMLGDHINYRYEILGELGQGTFGDVVLAFDHKRKRQVAIKITTNEAQTTEQAMIESHILQAIKSRDQADSLNVVHIFDAFLFRNHACIVFELLQENLYTALKDKDFVGMDLSMLRIIAKDVLTCLGLLREMGVVHCDLKPENILFCDAKSAHVKVIDFGSSCMGKGPFYGAVQSRYYRAPEVLLGLGFGPAIDMWSLGCILAELLTGKVLFPGRSETQQLMFQMEALGMPTDKMLKEGEATSTFFSKDGKPLTTHDQAGEEHGVGAKTVRMLLGACDPAIADFIERCLTMDPAARITPAEGLAHCFVQMQVPSKDSAIAIQSGASCALEEDSDIETSPPSTQSPPVQPGAIHVAGKVSATEPASANARCEPTTKPSSKPIIKSDWV